jgi:hypothetical protein
MKLERYEIEYFAPPINLLRLSASPAKPARHCHQGSHQIESRRFAA